MDHFEHRAKRRETTGVAFGVFGLEGGRKLGLVAVVVRAVGSHVLNRVRHASFAFAFNLADAVFDEHAGGQHIGDVHGFHPSQSCVVHLRIDVDGYVVEYHITKVGDWTRMDEVLSYTIPIFHNHTHSIENKLIKGS